MKQLNQFIKEGLKVGSKSKVKDNNNTNPLSPEEIKDILNNKVSTHKPAKFDFNNGAYILYPNYKDNIATRAGWGTSQNFPNSSMNTWYITLSSDNSAANTPAGKVIDWDYSGENVKKVYCTGNRWKASNGQGVYNASNKKLKIYDIQEEKDFIVFYINN